MNKMTMRNTVAEIKAFLGEAVKSSAVKADKDLWDMLKYANEQLVAKKRVPKKDLLDLATECFTVMAAAEEKSETAEPKKEVKPKKESSLKRRTRKSESKTDTESSSKESAEEPKKEPKPAKKSGGKSKSKTGGKKSSKKNEKKESKPEGFSFPEEFTDEDGVKYTRADDLQDIDSVREALEADEDLVIASHWTAPMLKDFDTYFYGGGQLPKKSVPKRFKNDLDLLTVVYVGEATDNILTVSMYTEAVYYWRGKDLKQTKKGRKGFNLEFEVYRAEEA